MASECYLTTKLCNSRQHAIVITAKIQIPKGKQGGAPSNSYSVVMSHGKSLSTY